MTSDVKVGMMSRVEKEYREMELGFGVGVGLRNGGGLSPELE